MDEIRLEALDLAVGDSKRIHCPRCGAKDEKSMKLTRTQSGISYKCFRGKCGYWGYDGQRPSGKPAVDTKYAKIHPFVRYTLPITPKFSIHLCRKYLLTSEEVCYNKFLAEEGLERLVMPILDPMYDIVGYVSKRLIGKFGPKAKTYWHKQVPNLHYPFCTIQDGPIVIVEDILSSIRVARHMRCRAILGTDLMDNVVDQLRNETEDIVLALDNDMIPKMVKQAKKLRGMFNVKIIRWTNDPKDSSDQTVKEEIRKVAPVSHS